VRSLLPSKTVLDIAELNGKGSIKTYATPPCLEDHPESIVNGKNAREAVLKHEPDLPMKDFVDFFIDNRYYIKGKACKNCSLNETCSGAHVEHVRRYGFPKPKAWMLAKNEPEPAA